MMKLFVMAALFSLLATGAIAQDIESVDSGVRFRGIDPPDTIIVVGVRYQDALGLPYEQHVQNPYTVTYDNSFGDSVYTSRYRLWGSDEGMALNLRSTWRDDETDRFRGIPENLGRDAELVICRFPPLVCFNAQ